MQKVNVLKWFYAIQGDKGRINLDSPQNRSGKEGNKQPEPKQIDSNLMAKYYCFHSIFYVVALVGS